MDEPVGGKVSDLTEIGREQLTRQDAVYFIGLMAAQSLRAFGQVTFVMTEDDKVALANPVHVYMDAQAIITEAGVTDPPKYRWVRPVLGTGRPQYCAWRNGELWEIEFEDPDESALEEAAGNDPH